MPRLLPTLLAAALAALLALAAPAMAEEARVLRVIDGDSLLVEMRGLRVQVRLLGIDCPEHNQEQWGELASRFSEEWCEGKIVDIELGPDRWDRYNRLLAWVWRDGEMLNEQLLSHGLAITYMLEKTDRHYKRLTAAQTLARTDRVGFWAQGGLNRNPSAARQSMNN